MKLALLLKIKKYTYDYSKLQKVFWCSLECIIKVTVLTIGFILLFGKKRMCIKLAHKALSKKHKFDGFMKY